MFAGGSDFGCLWVVVGAGRGLSLVVGVLGHRGPLDRHAFVKNKRNQHFQIIFIRHSIGDSLDLSVTHP